MCRSLKFLMEKLIKARHLRRYIRELDHEVESGQDVDRIVADLTIPTESRPVRPEKFQFLENGQNRNFGYKIVNFG